MIPRPDRGVIYCGKTVSGFELINNPSWYDQYMRLRRDQGHAEEDGPETWHAADVSQSWNRRRCSSRGLGTMGSAAAEEG